MGAPLGHPFFGNQYTNGGYVKGSFTYEGVMGSATQAIGKAADSLGAPKIAVLGVLSPKALTSQRMPAPSIPSLIAAGVIGLMGGAATFMYLRSRSTSTAEDIANSEDIANFGVCESCGEALASSGPAQLQQDNEGRFVVCENYSHRNRARYSEDEQESDREE